MSTLSFMSEISLPSSLLLRSCCSVHMFVQLSFISDLFVRALRCSIIFQGITSRLLRCSHCSLLLAHASATVMSVDPRPTVPSFEVRPSTGRGLGVFATEDIKTGYPRPSRSSNTQADQLYNQHSPPSATAVQPCALPATRLPGSA